MTKILVKGIPASPGIAEGEVRIINSPNEIEKMVEGAIFVASETTPEFVPAMLKARAIITDLGSMLSHPAIVARELGIPAVVGTGEATKKLKDGMRVKVDGGKGVVFLEEGEER
jgi:pyruvate,water dikinase